jgi:sec-independent protein translocase protein TatA
LDSKLKLKNHIKKEIQMDIGAPELIIILVVVLLIFGPGRIVKVARELGTGIRQFKQGLGASSEPEKPEEKTSSDEIKKQN